MSDRKFVSQNLKKLKSKKFTMPKNELSKFRKGEKSWSRSKSVSRLLQICNKTCKTATFEIFCRSPETAVGTCRSSSLVDVRPRPAQPEVDGVVSDVSSGGGNGGAGAVAG